MTDRSFNNRLLGEKSPYLLQHAFNPVDWYPWGEEAFKKAEREERPIFLSIGYATCHWCHVMERETFENEDIAQMMNALFVNIKVDREELPEVDSVYMEFAQAMMHGATGWPLNMVLTPDLVPFFAATYMPPFAQHGLLGMAEVIHRIRSIWEGEDREKIVGQAQELVDLYRKKSHTKGTTLPAEEMLELSVELLLRLADPVYGGMQGAPKFPVSYQQNFLMRAGQCQTDSRAVYLAVKTLDMMQRGGIYDHLGGGFSRYSVDQQWLVPHFEKMLYDNALIIQTYLEAWQLTKKTGFFRVAEHCLSYVLSEMTADHGGFYSAEDADSEGIEGLFYTWTKEEITALLGGGEACELFCAYYGISKKGNFEGRNILHTKQSIEEFAAERNIDAEDLAYNLEKQRQILLEARNKRTRPFKDDKQLSSWNGLMISSFVEGSLITENERYLKEAKKAAEFIRQGMWDEGTLLRRWREEEACYDAGLDEYAFLIRGLISLFEADCGSHYLKWALEMTKILENCFKAQSGAFYQTDGSDDHLLLRRCPFSDGAEPSGNAVHTENLLKLYQITANPHFLDQAEDVLRAVKQYIEAYAPGYTYHLMNLLRYYDRRAVTIVISPNRENEQVKQIYRIIYQLHLPHKVLIVRRDNDKELFSLIPFIEMQSAINDKTTVYLCREGSCGLPLNDLEEIKEALGQLLES